MPRARCLAAGFHSQEGLPSGFLETLEAKVSFLVGEAKRYRIV
jgi:hypothetical protein